MNKLSHFFAYIARMKLINRWALKRNTSTENIQEHSLQVAFIAHSLAVVKNKLFNGTINAERTAVLAMYHDASEIFTGDLPTPIKYYNPKIKDEYAKVEEVANELLLKALPKELKEEYEPFFFKKDEDIECWRLVKAADRIAAYLKCVEEERAGNKEFEQAKEGIKKDIDTFQNELEEVKYFMEVFVPSFSLNLDEMTNENDN
jgi:5'-deoxynucleotidase